MGGLEGEREVGGLEMIGRNADGVEGAAEEGRGRGGHWLMLVLCFVLNWRLKRRDERADC